MKKFFRGLIGIVLSAVCVTTSFSVLTFAENTKAVSDYVSGNLVTMLGSENYRNFIEWGVIAENPDSVKLKDTENKNAAIKSVKTYKNKYVVLTFDSGFAKANISDIKLQKYSDNWYTLKPKASDMKIKNSCYTVNNNGESVFIFEVNEDIDGTRIRHIKEGSNFEDLQAAIVTADNYISWQMDNGGWDKGIDGKTAWDGVQPKNEHSGWHTPDNKPVATIDNNATYTQIRHIAAVYRETKDPKYKESVEKGIDFIIKLQVPTGGLTQVYPKRGNYSDYVTFNDNAMINTLIMIEDMQEGNYPFDSDILSDEYKAKVDGIIDKAVDFIIKSQIESQGRLTGWCAQHDPVTYEPKEGRAYELASISGSESIPIIKFLMNRKDQTPEIQNAVECAIQYFKDSEVKGIRFDKNDPDKKYFIPDENSSLWYRFYEIGTNLPIFCDREGISSLTHNIADISEERRNGYAWSGTWPESLINVYDSVGYYPNKITALVSGTNSVTESGKKLAKNNSDDVKEEITEKDISDTFESADGKITAYNGTSSKIKIPVELNGVKVNSLGDNLFKNSSSVTEIFVPNEVSFISDDAFKGCDNAVIFCNKGSETEKFVKKNNLKYAVLGDTDGNKELTSADSAVLIKYTLDNNDDLFGQYGKRAAEYIDSNVNVGTAVKILNKVRMQDYEY